MARYDVIITPRDLDAPDGATYVVNAFPVSEGVEVFTCCKPLHLLGADTLVYGFSAMQEEGEGFESADAVAEGPIQENPRFISIQPGSGSVTVANVRVKGMTQKLDDAAWEDVIFTNCKIVCEGGPFDLAGTIFVNCDFSGLETLPSDLRLMLSSKRQKILFARFTGR